MEDFRLDFEEPDAEVARERLSTLPDLPTRMQRSASPSKATIAYGSGQKPAVFDRLKPLTKARFDSLAP